MNNIIKYSMIAALASTSLCTYAQELSSECGSEWKLSLGTSFRQFRDSKIKGFSSAGYIDGTVGNPVNPEQVTPGFGPFPSIISLHRLDGANRSASLEDTASFTLGASKELFKCCDRHSTNLELSLVYMQSDFSGSTGTGAITDAFIGDTIVEGDLPSGATDANIASHASIEIHAVTIGVGLSRSYNYDFWQFKVAAGPTATIVNYDTESKISQSFSGGFENNPGMNTYSDRRSDAGWDVRLGLYVAGEASYKINDNWSLGAELRYDWIKKLNTEVAEINMSGMSVGLKAIYSF
ncbi:MAG: opacity family porin [Lentisphaeria bacterium]